MQMKASMIISLSIDCDWPKPESQSSSTLGELREMSPRFASTHVVPPVEWAAIESSRLGVKIRTRRAFPVRRLAMPWPSKMAV
jgi:hypothetical protein